jgi:hypothetical protein
VQRLSGQQPGVDVRAQRSEPPRRGLSPVVDDDLVRNLEQRELDGAHRPVWHHERAGVDPLGPQQRLRALEARGLDDDVGAADARLPVVRHDHGCAHVLP